MALRREAGAGRGMEHRPIKDAASATQAEAAAERDKATSPARPRRTVADRAQLAPWQVKLATEMMEATNRPLVLAEVAEPLGISVNHFIKAFVNTMGTSPYHWFIRRRVTRSVELLRDPNLSLAQIAAECGFSDQSHFTRVFSRYVGVSPGKWRKRLEAGAAEAEGS